MTIFICSPNISKHQIFVVLMNAINNHHGRNQVLVLSKYGHCWRLQSYGTLPHDDSLDFGYCSD